MYIWEQIVSRLLEIHERYENGATHSDRTRQVDADIVIAMLSFVDNCNLSNTGPKHEYLKAILKRTEHDAQLWNDLIRASGRALNLNKCFTRVLYFKFSINSAPVVGTTKSDPKVDLINRFNNKVSINPILSYTTYSSLGTQQGISKYKSSGDQYRTLKRKTRPLIRALLGASVTPHQA